MSKAAPPLGAMADSLWTVADAFRYDVGPTIGQAASQDRPQTITSDTGRRCVRHGSASGFAHRHASSGTEPLLSVRAVSVRFGGIVALDGVSFDVAPGQVAGLIGPNGAGKTTLFNCLSRLYVPDDGDILFEGRSILRSRATPSRARHRPHVPERGAVRPHVGARQRQGRLPQPHLDGLHHQRAAAAEIGARGAPHHRARRGARRVHGPRGPCAPARRGTAVPGAQARRARPRARRQPQAAAARRAGRRASTTTRSTCCAGRSGACATSST